MSGEPVIEVRGVRTAFGDHVVHDGVDLTVEEGEIMGLVGGSGSGKSVLMHEMLDLMRPTAGEIRVFGKDIRKLSGRERAEIERRRGVLFQAGALFSQLTVLENVKVPLRKETSLPESVMDDLALMKISMVGLGPEAAAKYPSELSGGMRKRAGLARALALDPEILFLDEPTAGLDPISAAAIDRLLQTLRDALGLTVFLVTHDLDTLHAICDRVAVLGEGRLITIGTLDEVATFDHPWIKAYFSGPRGRRGQVDHGDSSDTGL